MRFDAQCLQVIEALDPNEAKSARELMLALRSMKRDAT